MGICHASPSVLSIDAKPTAKSKTNSSLSTSKPAPTFGKDATLRREDFIFSKIQTASFLAKLPGTINGQQFVIEDCHNCDIFLLDHCTSVQIDACINCRIVVGPCESSVFLRNCKRCTVICAVQQFRTRDCEDVDVYLYSTTDPIIETSSRMRFTCFPLTYFSLHQQFRQAKFSPWNNKWSEIFDFTPDHGGWKPLPMRLHESPLAEMMQETENSNGARSLWKMPPCTAEELGLSVDLPLLVVPITNGLCARKESTPTLFVCFVVGVDTTDSSGKPTLLIRTRQIRLTEEQASALFTDNKTLAGKAVETGKSTLGSVMMEFQGSFCYQHVNDALQEARFVSATSHTIFVSKDTTAALRLIDLVFHRWKPVV
ncbi:hypothetical protein PHMEG_00030394 [Phytophthora megakarya]|uniref:Protein XRP2 n=1 Tax=Phytophthora megakarya TaxID=4795 RepID=A0A225V0F5_9STRA|nr:hypothetical protein PHMEG_00030394 [Phytophthora megakarya]